jgi:hypothetical protein
MKARIACTHTKICYKNSNCLGLGKLDHRASLFEGGKKEKRRLRRRFSFFPPVLSRFSVAVAEPVEVSSLPRPALVNMLQK